MYETVQSMITDYAEAAMKVKTTAFSPKVNKVVQYIELNIKNELKLEQLATYVGLAPAYLSRVFNNELGTSLIQFITNMRMSKASDLLIRTSSNIESIAKQVGFNQTSYFSKKFKQHYHLAPTQYRAKFQKYL